MKKILFLLLLLSAGMYAQTSNGTETQFEGVQITNPQTVTNPIHAATVGSDGTVGKALPINLPIGTTFTNISPTTPTVEGVFLGIDSKLGAAQTTAGQTARVRFTADNTTVNSIVYFASSITGGGTAAAGSPPALSLANNTKAFFTKDVISTLQVSLAKYPPGTYAGQLTVSATPTPNATQQRFTVEIYKTDLNGVAIASGIAGAPIGALGVAVVTVLDSGIVNLVAGSITNVSVSGQLLAELTINPNERIRYHVSAAKIGAGGGNVTAQVYYGPNYDSYYDVPIGTTTDGVINKSTVTGITSTDALNWLNANKENIANKQNSLSADGTGAKYPTVDAINKRNTFTTPEEFGAIGDGTTNDATAFQNAVNSGKMVLLGSKTYLLNSTINITSAVKITGSGVLSVLKTTQNLPVFNITTNLVTLKSFKIEGNGRGTVTNYATTRPLQNGVKIDGAYYNNTIENVIFNNLGNAGIYGINNQNGVSTGVTSSINVNSCFFFGNLFGINFDTLFEYNLVYNSVFKNNETGLLIKGGNNPIVGGVVVNNRTGISVQSGSNDSHSTASSVSINHNIEYGINVGNIANGYTFSNCIVFLNPINLNGSNSVSLNGGEYKPDAPIVFTNTTNTVLQNVIFLTIPTVSLSSNTNLRFFNNSYPGGVVPSGMFESITNLYNTNIFDINATTPANNLIRMRVNGSSRFLLGSDSGITAGNDGDFNNYIYGNNSYLIYTNGVKRVTVAGDGKATYTNTVTAAPATVDTELATLGQVKTQANGARYTPTFTNVSNSTSITGSATYTRIGNVVTVFVQFNLNATAIATSTSFTLSLPVNRTTGTTLNNIGSGFLISLDGVYVHMTNGSGSQAQITFNSGATSGSKSGNASFQYLTTD